MITTTAPSATATTSPTAMACSCGSRSTTSTPPWFASPRWTHASSTRVIAIRRAATEGHSTGSAGCGTPTATRWCWPVPTAPPCSRPSGGSMQLPRLAHHLLHLGDVLLLKLDLVASVLLQPPALAGDQGEQVVILVERDALVVEGLVEDLTDLVLVRLDQLADLQ